MPGQPSPYEITDRCWGEEDFTFWYQLHKERKKGPWRDIKQAYAEMMKARAERAKHISEDEMLDQAEREWEEKKKKIAENTKKNKEKRRRKAFPL